jgi:multidrug resistance efflux pump
LRTRKFADVLQGYGEADYIYLSSQDAGVVGEVFVREGDAVEAGARVFRLDPDRLNYGAESAQAQRAAAAAAVRTAQAQATLAQRNYARSAQLPIAASIRAHGSMRIALRSKSRTHNWRKRVGKPPRLAPRPAWRRHALQDLAAQRRSRARSNKSSIAKAKWSRLANRVVALLRPRT